jgi:uncharacterized pyridoxamine 5'-phosphate oxidase family protein
MNKDFLYNFISKRKYAVLSTVTSKGKPEAALVGIAVAPDLRLIFDTVSTSRKYRNLTQNGAIALVIGWDNEQTIQYEGRVIVPEGIELDSMLELYFKVFPEGKERKKNWKDITYFVVIPEWIRYSEFSVPPIVEETDFTEPESADPLSPVI